MSFPDKNGSRLIGAAAKNAAPQNPESTIFDVKRLIGRKFSDPSVQRDKSLLPYAVVGGEGGKASVKVSDKVFSPEEVSGMVSTLTLTKLT